MIYYSDLLPDDRVRIAILFGKNRPEDELEFADYLDQLKIPWTTVNMWVFDGEFISIPVWSFKHLTRHTLRKAISAILYITRNPDCHMEYSGFPLLMSNILGLSNAIISFIIFSDILDPIFPYQTYPSLSIISSCAEIVPHSGEKCSPKRRAIVFISLTFHRTEGVPLFWQQYDVVLQAAVTV